MKNRLFVYILLFTGVTSFGQNLEIPQFGTDSTLEVMTWNIEWFPKNGQITLDYVNEIIMDLDIDILALQEIDDKIYFDQLIESIEGWNAYYVNSEYSNLAYVYKTDVIEIIDIYEIYTTSEYWRPFPRAPMVFEFMFMSQKYILINNHFKCCGDGYLDPDDPWDEETRRLDASNLLEEYISNEFQNEHVILLGDLNDLLTDPTTHNVFNVYIDNEEDYQFVDMDIAEGSSYNWSYPSWPSHIDHLLITNEIFDDFLKYGSDIQTLRLDEYFDGGFSEYDANVSDHRPVALKLITDTNLGFGENKKQEPLIYPNPCQEKLYLNFENNDFVKVRIMNLNGQKLKELELFPSDNAIDVDFLREGMYFINLSGNQVNYTIKFVKAN